MRILLLRRARFRFTCRCTSVQTRPSLRSHLELDHLPLSSLLHADFAHFQNLTFYDFIDLRTVFTAYGQGSLGTRSYHNDIPAGWDVPKLKVSSGICFDGWMDTGLEDKDAFVPLFS